MTQFIIVVAVIGLGLLCLLGFLFAWSACVMAARADRNAPKIQ